MLKAVITGDIIHSTKMKPEELYALFQLLEQEFKNVKKTYPLIFEIFQGDSFQCLIQNPANSLRVALIIKTFLRGSKTEGPLSGLKKVKKDQDKLILLQQMVDARMAIGVGEVEMIKEKLAVSNGIAFQLSGRMLEELKNAKQHFAITSDDKYKEEWQTQSILLDTIISKTSSLQCQVLNYKLKGFTETEIAKELKIGQSAVNQRSNSGSWNAINAMLKRFEGVYANE